MTQYAADFAKAQLSAADLLGAGYIGALRYITGSDKQISQVEFDDKTHATGFWLALINETYAQAAQGGYAVGRGEALAAFGRAQSLGWPTNRPILFVCEDPNWLEQPSWAAIEQYLRGVASVAPVSRIGDYGSSRQIAHMMALGLCSYGWAVETWPGDHMAHNLVQLYNPVPGAPHNFNGQVDPNMILKADWGQWSAVNVAPTSAYQEEDEMQVFQYGGQEHLVGVDSTGSLIHRVNHPVLGWNVKETRATGCKVGGKVGVDANYKNQLHLYADRPDNSIQHCWFENNVWTGEIVG